MIILKVSRLKDKPHNQKCWNLEFNDNKAICKIHHEKFYKRSPCDSHTQIEKGDTDCRVGVYYLGEGAEVLGYYKQMEVAVPDIMEIPNGKSKLKEVYREEYLIWLEELIKDLINWKDICIRHKGE
jgi:hypothetical protein